MIGKKIRIKSQATVLAGSRLSRKITIAVNTTREAKITEKIFRVTSHIPGKGIYLAKEGTEAGSILLIRYTSVTRRRRINRKMMINFRDLNICIVAPPLIVLLFIFYQYIVCRQRML
jgi:hypothetical protein